MNSTRLCQLFFTYHFCGAMFLAVLPSFSAAQEEIVQLKGHTKKPISGLLFTPNGGQIISANRDELRIWDWKTKKLIYHFDRADEKYPASIICVTPNDGLLVIAGRVRYAPNHDGWKILMLDPEKNRTRIIALSKANDEQIVGFLPARNVMVIAAIDRGSQTIRGLKLVSVFDGSAKEIPWEKPPIIGEPKSRFRGWTSAFSTDGTRMAVVGDNGLTIRSVDSNKTMVALKADPKEFAKAWFSKDAKMLISVNDERTALVHFWDLERKERKYDIELLSSVKDAAPSPNGKVMAFLGVDSVSFFSFSTERIEKRMELTGFRFRCLRFSPDGKNIVVGDDSGAVVVLRVPMINVKQ